MVYNAIWDLATYSSKSAINISGLLILGHCVATCIRVINGSWKVVWSNQWKLKHFLLQGWSLKMSLGTLWFQLWKFIEYCVNVKKKYETTLVGFYSKKLVFLQKNLVVRLDPPNKSRKKVVIYVLLPCEL